MPSVMTLLFAAFMMSTSDADDIRPPTFCADVQPFELFKIADDDESFADGAPEDMGCTESDSSGPLDVEAILDTI